MSSQDTRDKGKRLAGFLRPVPVFFIVTALSALVYGFPMLGQIFGNGAMDSYRATLLLLYLALPVATGLMAALGVHFGFHHGPTADDALTGELPGGPFTTAERARAILRHLPTAVLTLDMDGRVTYYNPSAPDLPGMEPGRGREQFAGFLEEVGIETSLEKIRDGKTVTLEKKLPDPAAQGTERTWRVTGSPVTRQGKTVEALLLIEDITQMRSLEEDLVRSEERYRSIFNHAPCGIFFVDDQGHYLDANPAALQMLGYTLTELARLTTREVSADSDRRLRKLRETPGWVEEETRYLNKDGSIVEAQLTASRYQSGDRTYFIGIAKDVTARRELERSLAAAKARLKAVLSLESRPLILLDGEDRVANVNTAAADLLGCEPDALLGKNLSGIIEGAPPGVQDPSTASAAPLRFVLPGKGSRELPVMRLPLGSRGNPGSLLVIG